MAADTPKASSEVAANLREPILALLISPVGLLSRLLAPRNLDGDFTGCDKSRRVLRSGCAGTSVSTGINYHLSSKWHI